VSSLRILIVPHHYPSAYQPHRGSFVHKWANQLVASGCEVRVLTANAITLGTYLRSWKDVLHFYRSPRRHHYEWQGQAVDEVRYHLGLPIQYSNSAPKIAQRFLRPAMESIRRESPFDVILSTNGEYLALAASRLAKEMRIPHVTTAIGSHVNCCWQQPESRRFQIEAEIFSNSELAVCVSEDMSKKVRHMTGDHTRTFTFYAGVDPDFFRPEPEAGLALRAELGMGEEEPLLVFVGNLIRGKGILELIEVFAALAAPRPTLRLALIGENVEKAAVAQAIRDSGAEDRILLTGALPQKEIIRYLNAANAFVFPSWNEGLPNAIMEAAACAVPIVASNVGGIPEVLEDGATGRLIEPKDAAALRQAIEEILESPETARAQGRAAREKILQDFDYHKNGPKLVERIEEVVRNYGVEGPAAVEGRDNG
jgi:teichuronic acid biosynthesis glycosyltransferase TuaC